MRASFWPAARSPLEPNSAARELAGRPRPRPAAAATVAVGRGCLTVLPAAVLEFFAAVAGARIVATHLGPGPDRHGFRQGLVGLAHHVAPALGSARAAGSRVFRAG